MAIIASTPDAFFDREAWAFTLIIAQPGGAGPLDLTGSRLYARFVPAGTDVQVGVCDSAAGDGSLAIAPGVGGTAAFRLSPAGRTWRAPRGAKFAMDYETIVGGDLYCLPPGGTDADWQAVCRIEFPVVPSPGVPVR